MRLKFYRGQWAAVWREGGQTRRVSLRTSDRDLAAQRLADLTQAAPAGNTAAAIYSAWQKDKQEARSAPRAIDAWKALAPHFGHLRPDQTDRTTCRAYIARRRARGRSDGTIGRELSCLRASLRWNDRNTPALIELPPQPAPKERYLTRGEYERLRDAAKSPHIRLFIILALATAGRASALLDLTWDRVDLDRGRIVLSDGTVGGKRRAVVPMTDTARIALTEYAAAALTPWVIEWAGKKVGSIKKGFERAVIAAGLVDVTPHVLRHTAAVWMAESGVPMEAIAQYLGHSDARTTYRVYARFSPDYLAGAAKALET